MSGPPTTPPTTDVFTPEQRSAVMARVRARDTGPERLVRRMLTDMSVRYRLHRKDLPGRPDLALGPRRLAVFVHGCFWHGHDCARGGRKPRQNAAYWEAKIARNRARDSRNVEALSAIGWRALTVWECELKDGPILRARLEHELAIQARSSPRAQGRAEDPEDATPSAASPPAPPAR